MNWVDPKIWDGEKTYRIEQITALITHLEVPLKAAGLDSKAIFKERRFFQKLCESKPYGCQIFTAVETDFYPQKREI